MVQPSIEALCSRQYRFFVQRGVSPNSDPKHDAFVGGCVSINNQQHKPTTTQQTCGMTKIATILSLPAFVPQQHPSDNSIKPGRRERVSDPARDLICC